MMTAETSFVSDDEYKELMFPRPENVRTLVDLRKPRWDNLEQTSLTCEALFEEQQDFGFQGFTTEENADTPHGVEVWTRVKSGEFGLIEKYVAPDPVPVVTIIPAVTLWERMTEDEAEQVAEVMATQPFRTRKIFETAATFRSDHELWPLLEQIANQLFGEARAAELLAQ